MDFSEFKTDFWTEIKTTAESDGEGSSAAFVKTAVQYLTDADVLPEMIPSFFSGVGKRNRRLRIDGYFYDETDQTLILLICDYEELESRDTLSRTDAGKYFDRLKYFIEEGWEYRLDVEESTPVSDLVTYLTSKDRSEKIRKFRLVLLSNAVMSDRIKEIQSEDICGIPAALEIWDLTRIFQICTSETGRDVIEIDFQQLTGGIPCIEASDVKANDYKSYLCIISGKTLADIYDQYGGKLLEENVRMFLTNTSSVNKKIRKTILEQPERFFAYNNGISVTVRDLTLESRKNGTYITHTTDFQIINGGQTTASLSNTRYKNKTGLDNIYVPMKLTLMRDQDPDKASQLTRDISYSANSQNKVTDADFFSTHPYHIRMEHLSREIFAPAARGEQYSTQWYYERVRGQYLQTQARMTKAEKQKFTLRNPKSQVINKTTMSKVQNTWMMKPDVVSKGSQFNFKNFADHITKEWDNNKETFDEQYYKESVALYILFKYTENMVTQQTWYEGGFRANIVTYTLALFHKRILDQFSGYDLNLILIWAKQEVPDVVKTDLISLSKIVYDVITDDERPVENVTQWCKQEKCWNEVKQSYYLLDKEIGKILTPVQT